MVARQMHCPVSMHKAWALQRRTECFAVLVEALAVPIADNPGAQTIVRRLLTTTRAVVIGYKDVSASSSPEKFIAGISAVASNAKKARAALILLVELGHLSIEMARESILEARGLEAIFVASRNTAKKRARGRMVSRRNPSERADQAPVGKSPGSA